MTIATNNAFFDWLMDVLRAIAQIRTPVLDALMRAVTYLGEEMVFLLVGLTVFWCIDKRFGYRLLWVELIGNALNQALKLAFRIPRPWKIDPDFAIVESARAGATGFSFPSGHTQGVTMLFGMIAHRIRKGWAYAAAALLAVLVAFSRMYLGVHTLLDVCVGLFVGIGVVALGEWLFSKLGDSDRVYFILVGIAVLLCVGLTTAALLTGGEDVGQYKDAAMLAGMSLALLFGSMIERRFVNFDTGAAWWAQILKVVIGMALMLGLKEGLKPLLALISDSPVMNGVRYGVLAFVAVALYPMTFRLFAKTKKN